MNALKTLTTAVALFAVVATTALPAAADTRTNTVDRKIATMYQLVQRVQAHPETSAEANGIVAARYREVVTYRDKIAEFDRLLGLRASRNREHQAKYAKYARLYNAKRHRLSRAVAAKLYAVLAQVRRAISEDATAIASLRGKRDKALAEVDVALDKYIGIIRQVLADHPAS